MVGITEASVIINSIKAAKDIAESMIGLRDAEVVRARVLEIQSKLLDAQGAAFSANEARSDLLDRVRALEAKLAEAEGWHAERARYELRDVGKARGSVFVYSLKADKADGEPAHFLCAECFQRGKKSILQAKQELRMGLRAHFCPSCQTEFAFREAPELIPQPATAITDYDIFKDV